MSYYKSFLMLPFPEVMKGDLASVKFIFTNPESSLPYVILHLVIFHKH